MINRQVPPGSYPAPAMRVLNLPGLRGPLIYPARRLPVALAVWVVSLVLAGSLGLDAPLGASILVLATALAVGAAVVIVPQPRPAFLGLDDVTAGDVQAGSWVRHRGYAVQVLNSHIRGPDVAGDPTPPVVVLRFSDNTLWQFRPHDVLPVVQPVDTRWQPAKGRQVPAARRPDLGRPPRPRPAPSGSITSQRRRRPPAL